MAELTPEHVAVKQRWRLPTAQKNWEVLIAQYLETLARRCHDAGRCVTGHIKALALFPGGGYLRISVVSPALPASVEGSVPEGCTELVLTLNVIVYGLARNILEKITQETAADLMNQWGEEIMIEPI